MKFPRTILCLLCSTLLHAGAAEAQRETVFSGVPPKTLDSKQFKRFEWLYRQRALPSDTIPIHRYTEEIRRARANARAAPAAPADQLSWSQIGPASILNGFPAQWGYVSGRVRAVALHPADDAIVYIGAAEGGIWKTTDGGATWADKSAGFTTSSFGAIAVDPARPETVYAGTGEVMGFSTPFVFDGNGLYRSTDGGASWSHITAGFGAVTHFASIAVSPHNPDLVFAALARGYWHIGPPIGNEGVWRSTDAGASWTRTYSSSPAFDVVVHPTDTNVVYAATGTDGFYVSTDRGASWTTSNTGLPSAIVRIQAAVSLSSPSTLYAAVFKSDTTKAFKSTDGGANWFQIHVGQPLGGNYGGGWSDGGWWDLAIAVDPSDPDHVLIGNTEIHRSTDGANFQPVRVPPMFGAWDSPMHVDYHAIRFSAVAAGHVWVGNDGGIYRSTNYGSNWSSRNNSISSIQLYRVASHPTDPDVLVGGAQDNGNFRTADRGATAWTSTTTGDGMEGFYDHTDPSTVYASTQQGALYRNPAGGDPNWWSFISPNWPATPSWLVPFFMHPTDNLRLYTASRRVWRSTDAGGSWTAITGDVTADNINTMAQSAVDPDRMILAGSGLYTTDPEIMVSSDGGSSWTDVKANVPGLPRYVSRVVTHPTSALTFFVVRSGFGSGKVYKTTDAGVTWTDVSGNLPDIPHSDLFIDPLYTGRYYVANDFGVYYSADSGAGWTRMGEGMPYVVATDFDFFSGGGARLLRVATHGRSVYEAHIPLDLDISPATIAFGTIPNGTSAADTLEVRNTGPDPLIFSLVASTNGSFTVSPPSDTIASGDSADYIVTFTPSSVGSHAGTVVFTHSGPTSPDSVSVSGSASVTVSVVKLRDGDGHAATTGDRTPVQWRLTLYKGAISGGNVVAQGDSGFLAAAVLDTGIYIACEADSGILWSRLNGNGLLCDTFFVGQTAVSDTFVNFRENTLTLRKLLDADSSLATTGSRVPIEWPFGVHADSADGSIVAAAAGDSVFIDGLPDGTYAVVEDDSAGWRFLGYELDGVPTADSSRAAIVSFSGGEDREIVFINTSPEAPVFWPALLTHHFGIVTSGSEKTDTVTIENVGGSILVVDSILSDDAEFSSLTASMIIDPSNEGPCLVRFSPLSAGAKSANLVIYHTGRTSPDTVQLLGDGEDSLTISYSAGWEMVSLPMEVTDSAVTSVFPDAISSAFGYTETGYVTVAELSRGKGYWLKYFGAGSEIVRGAGRSADTIEVAAGWNMIGSVSQSVPVGSIVSIPGGMVTSSFFGYDAGYFTASEIEPGAGYWVKASEAGQLVLSSSDAVPQAGRIRIEDVSTPPLPPPDPESSDPGGTTIPTATALHQNFPNPFNPMTEIRYDLTRPGMVSLKIYDLGGAEVATLVEGHKPAGTATVSWDAGTLPSGVYLCRLRTEEEGLTTKLLLLK